MRKVRTHLRRKRKKEHVTSVESVDISHESVKMAAKRDTVAQHGETQQEDAAEAEEEESTSTEGAETSGSKEPARASGASKERTHG